MYNPSPVRLDFKYLLKAFTRDESPCKRESVKIFTLITSALTQLP